MYTNITDEQDKHLFMRGKGKKWRGNKREEGKFITACASIQAPTLIVKKSESWENSLLYAHVL